jgi:hypothetical protein
MQHNLFPFTFNDFDAAGDDQWQYYDVEWTMDFGAFARGEKCACLCVDMSTARIDQYDEADVVKTTFFGVFARH